MIVIDVLIWIIRAIGEVVLFALIMNIVTGAIAGGIALQWYLMRKLSCWFE